MSDSLNTGIDEDYAKHARSFNERGANLLQSLDASVRAGDDDQTQRLMDNVQEWLDSATAAPAGVVPWIWGGLCLGLHREHDNGQHGGSIDADTDRIASYLNAMVQCEEEQLMAYAAVGEGVAMVLNRHSRPNCDALHELLGSLVGPGMGAHSVFLQVLMARGKWNADALLLHLYDGVQAQSAYLHERWGRDADPLRIPYYGVAKLLCAATLWTDWRPSDNPACGNLWNVISTIIPTRAQYSTLVQCFLESMPGQAVYALDHVVHNTLMSPERAAMFFPLNIESSNKRVLLDHLIGILAMSRKPNTYFLASQINTSLAFEQQLLEHHPEVHRFLMMHFGLFPESTWDNPLTQMSLAAFECLCEGQAAEVSLELPELEMSHHAP